MYIDCEVCPKQIEGVDTELRYAIACARANKENLIRFCFCYEEERVIKQALRRARAVFKEEKQLGKIMLYLFSSDFGSDTMEMEYLRNQYPTIEEDELLQNCPHPYALVRIGDRE
jgi:hypothetical protein